MAQLIVRSRMVQGWNLQPAADARLAASIWEEQLDRRGIDYRLYTKLVEMAVDYRAAQIERGLQPIPLTCELLLACFEYYKRRTLEEHQRMKVVIDALCSTCEMVANDQKSLTLGWADLATVTDIPEQPGDLTEFSVTAGQVIGELQKKYDEFLEEKYLNA